ncbi:MAG: hypothetical protein A3F80_03925 [Candidatus Melainabacteria bacterium RIFCSPLOWO2_12_FULL_35_11]|nr:MAG: hypothetical protein A3F80_03925 [Candidatus Melainabacteria bacterium RIFCSPLOWO2_12_FULL_35_11]
MKVLFLEDILAEAALNAMLVVNKEGTITLANPTAEVLFGYKKGELTGQKIEVLVPECFRAAHVEQRDSFFADPKIRSLGAGRDLFGCKKDGTEVPIEIGLNPIKTAEEIFVLASVIDITERKKIEQKLKDSAKEIAFLNGQLEQYAYITSHDLKEPLRAMYSYAALLEKKYKEKLDKNADDYINFIVGGAKRMESLINDLLEYTHIGSKRKPLTKTDCNKLLETVLKNLKVVISENNAKVACDSLPEIFTDENQISVLFQNLIVNAIKFTKHGSPEINISCKQEGSDWLFAIKDNGIGIPKEQKERIFQIFQRLHTKEEYEGTGIGLAICKKIVDLHGGKIWVESEEGKGSTFYFTLPMIYS